MRDAVRSFNFRVTLTLVCALTAGCISPAARAQRSINDFISAHRIYDAKCVAVQGPPACVGVYYAKRAHEAAIREVDAAISRGGAAPMQLAEMKRAEAMFVKLAKGLP